MTRPDFRGIHISEPNWRLVPKRQAWWRRHEGLLGPLLAGLVFLAVFLAIVTFPWGL